jgi:hypothetical protein
MTSRNGKPSAKIPDPVRCAVYMRKSTEDGLEQEFNSLDAQREAGEAYIKSQAHEGWECLPDHYDDGGFAGGNMERPALQATSMGRLILNVLLSFAQFEREMISERTRENDEARLSRFAVAGRVVECRRVASGHAAAAPSRLRSAAG